nr:glucose/ribitol dehydrogenase [Tanacetum cinerariifolium]
FAASKFLICLQVNNAAEIGIIMHEEFRTGGGFAQVDDALTNVIDETYELGEKCLNINYYGTKDVTETLIPLLQLSKSPRIVNVTSMGGDLRFLPNKKLKEELQDIETLTEERIDEIIKWFLSDFKNANLQENGWPSTVSAYKVSKIALIIVNCVHPGYVVTDMTFQTGYMTVEEGAKSPVMVALLPDDGPSGVYFNQTQIAPFASPDFSSASAPSSSSPSSTNGRKSRRVNAPGARTDVGWGHAIDLGQKKVKCKFCMGEFSGGIYRFKHHLARTHKDAGTCPMVPEDIKLKFQKVVEQMDLAASKKRRLHLVDEDEQFESDERTNVSI